MFFSKNSKKEKTTYRIDTWQIADYFLYVMQKREKVLSGLILMAPTDWYIRAIS